MYRLATALAVVLALSGCTRPSDDAEPTETIGAVLAMTGPGASYGEEARNGIEIAIENLQAQDDSLGHDYRYRLQDSQTDAAASVGALRTLLAQDRPPAFISFASNVVLALGDVAEQSKVVQLNVLAQSPDVAKEGPYTFSLINLAPVESEQVARYAAEVLGSKRAAILYADADYGEGARAVFSSAFPRRGGAIVQETRYPADGQDFRAQIQEIRNANPDLVYLVGTAPDMARVLRQSAEAGFRTQWISYQAFENTEVLRLAGQAAEGVVFSSALMDWQAATGAQAAFRDRYQARFGKLPSVVAANSYDAVMLVARAVEAKGATGPAVREFLAALGPYEGVSGTIRFRQDGTVEKPLVFKVVRNGAFVRAPDQQRTAAPQPDSQAIK
jgi:branched-chain amino acid transport system substrate-binding protein